MRLLKQLEMVSVTDVLNFFEKPCAYALSLLYDAKFKIEIIDFNIIDKIDEYWLLYIKKRFLA